MSTTTAVNSTAAGPRTSPTSGYMSVEVEMLRRLRITAVDLFVQLETKGPVMLYHRAGSSIETRGLHAWADNGVQSLLVRTDDFHCFGKHLLESVESFAEGEAVPHAERYAALQLALAMEIERSAQSIDCGPYVAMAEQVGPQLVALVGANQVLPRDLFRLARHDFNTFTHVTNVASYAVVLAERLGISDPDALKQIAVGGLLHDLGKRFIPTKILTKPARLQPAERALVETHPARGYADLCRRPGLNFAQLMMVYQHHERMDGTGYPVGSCDDEIHPWARMLAVVDVFDALTGIRPYRRSATADNALDYIRKNVGTHFDREVVECWDAAMTNA